MIITNMAKAIIDHIEPELIKEDYKLENSNHEFVPVKLFESYLPIRSANERREKYKENDFEARREEHKKVSETEETESYDIDTEDIPCIIIRPLSGTESVEKANAKVKLIFITYSENSDGFKNCLNLMESVRRILTTNTLISGEYIYKRTLNWRLFEDQPWPYWYSEMDIDIEYGYYEDNDYY